jgi:hypothetical protein
MAKNTGLQNPDGRRAGDMTNIVVDEKGRGENLNLRVESSRNRLVEGAFGRVLFAGELLNSQQFEQLIHTFQITKYSDHPIDAWPAAP